MNTKVFTKKNTLVLILSCLALNAFAQYGEINGTVLDENKEPITGVHALVYCGGICKGGSLTYSDGRYSILPLAPGNDYELKIIFPGCDSVVFQHVIVKDKCAVTFNANFRLTPEIRRQRALPSRGCGGVGDFRHPHGVLDIKDIKKNNTGVASTAKLLMVTSQIHPLQNNVEEPKLYYVEQADIKKPQTGLMKSIYTNPNHINKEDIAHIR